MHCRDVCRGGFSATYYRAIELHFNLGGVKSYLQTTIVPQTYSIVSEKSDSLVYLINKKNKTRPITFGKNYPKVRCTHWETDHARTCVCVCMGVRARVLHFFF